MTIHKINAMSQAQLIRLLLDDDLTCHELADQTGLGYRTVCEYMLALHKAGAAYIADYRQTGDGWGRDGARIFKLGTGRSDKPKSVQTNCQKSRKLRARLKAQTLQSTVFAIARPRLDSKAVAP